MTTWRAACCPSAVAKPARSATLYATWRQTATSALGVSAATSGQAPLIAVASTASREARSVKASSIVGLGSTPITRAAPRRRLAAPAPTPTSSTTPATGSASRATSSEGVSSPRPAASSAASMNTRGSKKYGGSGAGPRRGRRESPSQTASRPTERWRCPIRPCARLPFASTVLRGGPFPRAVNCVVVSASGPGPRVARRHGRTERRRTRGAGQAHRGSEAGRRGGRAPPGRGTR